VLDEDLDVIAEQENEHSNLTQRKSAINMKQIVVSTPLQEIKETQNKKRSREQFEEG